MKLQSLLFVIGSVISATSFAAPLSLWSTEGWTQIDAEDGVGANGYVGPGWGGQAFDAEYLYYKLEGSVLSVGVQTGFNLLTGKVTYGGKDYYAGDLALSFDGIGNGYEYGIDFGLLTKNYSNVKVDMGSGTGIDAAGLYRVTTWNNDIYFAQSAPYAADVGSLANVLLSNDAGLIGDSYYRKASFVLDSSIANMSALNFNAHWTMSCGNDVLNGQANLQIDEPAVWSLILMGLLGLGMSRRRANNV